MKIIAASLSRPPTNHDGMSLVSASMAVQVPNVTGVRRGPLCRCNILLLTELGELGVGA